MKQMVMMKSLPLFASLFLATACGGNDSQPTQSSQVMNTVSNSAESDPFVVKNVDLTRYTGVWFEIAAIPRPFQSFCSKTKAEYQIIGENEISVVNSCKVGFAPITIEGTARVVDEKTNAVLEVSFKNIRTKGDYRIIALDDDYQYALVTDKERTSLFVLSRTIELESSIYESLLERAKAAGVDVSKVKLTSQK